MRVYLTQTPSTLAGAFPALEDELCGLIWRGGYEGPGRSPDRADAMVWALTALMLDGWAGRLAVRGLLPASAVTAGSDRNLRRIFDLPQREVARRVRYRGVGEDALAMKRS